MKLYYGVKVLLLNILSFLLRKTIGIERVPQFILDWFISRYLHNLNKLVTAMNDNESLQKLELLRYTYDTKKEEQIF